MSAHDRDEPLARYLADMLTEPGDGEESVAPEPEPSNGGEPAPQAEAPEPTSQPPENVAWWGFGVAHLILVLPGADVAGAEESVPPGLEWTPGRAGQGRFRLGPGEREVVDPAMLILPAAHRERLSPLAERAAGLLHLSGCDLTLVTGSEPLPVSLESDEVRWRMEKGDRPWMAGTVMSRNIVVLDANGLRHSLSNGGE
jgi:purine-binding chemotaxis protein CheW